MTYYQSAEGITIDRKRALRELAKHGIEAGSEQYWLFLAECGDGPYRASDVLEWLGY